MRTFPHGIVVPFLAFVVNTPSQQQTPAQGKADTQVATQQADEVNAKADEKIKRWVDGAKSAQPYALESIQQAVASGDSDAQVALGMVYSGGWGVRKDFGEAVRLWKQASESGNTRGMYLLGAAYNNGEGVDADVGKTLEYWRKASQLGNATAMIHLGMLQMVDQSDPKKNQRESATEAKTRLKESLYWLGQAGEHGDACANFFIGQFYQSGKGMEINHQTAIEHFLKSAEQGCPPSQAKLGDIYFAGKIVPKNKIEAYKWWSIALGSVTTLQGAVDDLGKSMTVEELSKARKMAEDWKTQHPAKPQ